MSDQEPTLEDELEELLVTDAVLDGQYDWIRERYGDEAAECANYGLYSEQTEDPLGFFVSTKVYGHGVLHTTARRGGAGFEVAHEFVPFGSPADIASRRVALEQVRQLLEAGRFDTDPPGAPPGARERVQQWLETELLELLLEEPPPP